MLPKASPQPNSIVYENSTMLLADGVPTVTSTSDVAHSGNTIYFLSTAACNPAGTVNLAVHLFKYCAFLILPVIVIGKFSD